MRVKCNILCFSVKSLAAAGKFKNRRYKKETNTSKQTMGAFLSWFRGSQALDRIIKLERMGIPDDKILMEINYMVKKVKMTKMAVKVKMVKKKKVRKRRMTNK